MNIQDFFRQINSESIEIKKKHGSVDKIPDGYLLAGFDSLLVKPIVVLSEIFKTKTQWSCQGHKDSKWNLAYIRFQEGVKAPDILIKQLSNKGFSCGYINPFKDEREFYVIRAYDDEDKLTLQQKEKLNEEFVKELNLFSDKYFQSIITE